MKCTITKMRISGALSSNSAIDVDSSMHIAGCESCRHFLTGNAKVAGQMGRMRKSMEQVTPKLHRLVMDAVSQEASKKACNAVSFPAYMIRSIVPLAAAASLAVVLMVFVWDRAGSGNSGIETAAANSGMPEYMTSFDRTLSTVTDGIVPAVTSSYDKELVDIRNDLASAGSFFSGCYSYAGVLTCISDSI